MVMAHESQAADSDDRPGREAHVVLAVVQDNLEVG